MPTPALTPAPMTVVLEAESAEDVPEVCVGRLVVDTDVFDIEDDGVDAAVDDEATVALDRAVKPIVVWIVAIPKSKIAELFLQQSAPDLQQQYFPTPAPVHALRP